MQGITQRTTTGVIQGDTRGLDYSSHSDIATFASVNLGCGFGQGPRASYFMILAVPSGFCLGSRG